MKIYIEQKQQRKEGYERVCLYGKNPIYIRLTMDEK